MTTLQQIGQDAHGKHVQRVTLSGGGLTMTLLSWGCVVQDLRLVGHPSPLVLGFDEFEHYLQHSPFFGSTAGRFANRIANGQFTVDGSKYQSDRNFLGKHTLHGGSNSLGKRNWQFGEVKKDRAVLEITDPDGEMGFPGTCNLKAVFSLPGNGRMNIRYECRTDKATPVSLAHHSYFNLSGEADICGHELQIRADRYLPVDSEAIPLGTPQPVEGTGFDFRKLRSVATGDSDTSYDHNYCLSDVRLDLREVARLHAPKSEITMQLLTTEPGLQFYDGHKLEVPVSGLDGRQYGARAGLCLEPQVWPDAPNRPEYPSSILRPGELYSQETEFRFSRAV